MDREHDKHSRRSPTPTTAKRLETAASAAGKVTLYFGYPLQVGTERISFPLGTAELEAFMEDTAPGVSSRACSVAFQGQWQTVVL